MLGSGSLESEVKQRLALAGLDERVHFPGQVEYAHLPDYYRAADLYLSASHSDGSSVSLLEAMGCGLPALVSDIPGNREWVDHGTNGWLFPDGDTRALRLALLERVEAPESLPDAGARARERVESLANWDDNFRRLLGAYSLALDGKPEVGRGRTGD
jgi:glycosyltransferase involved in cell wall biosynthesis